MMPGELDGAVVTDRTSWIRNMLAGIRELPLSRFEDFARDRHVVAAAESYVRRAIESLVDLGRHILAKRFAIAVSEYKAIPAALEEAGVLAGERVQTFRKICGYRNRLVHFYDRVSERELFEICTRHSADIEDILTALIEWIEADRVRSGGARG